jgi:hypothetical protein
MTEDLLDGVGGTGGGINDINVLETANIVPAGIFSRQCGFFIPPF